MKTPGNVLLVGTVMAVRTDFVCYPVWTEAELGVSKVTEEVQCVRGGGKQVP